MCTAVRDVDTCRSGTGPACTVAASILSQASRRNKHLYSDQLQ